MAEAIDLAWDALNALPRPIDDAAALAAVRPILEPRGLMQQFEKWWSGHKEGNAHGPIVLRRLNG